MGPQIDLASLVAKIGLLIQLLPGTVQKGFVDVEYQQWFLKHKEYDSNYYNYF